MFFFFFFKSKLQLLLLVAKFKKPNGIMMLIFKGGVMFEGERK